MRGPAAPTSPGPWDSRSEALLSSAALTTGTARSAVPAPPHAGLDLSAATAPATAPVPAPAAAPAVTTPAVEPKPLPAGTAEAIQRAGTAAPRTPATPRAPQSPQAPQPAARPRRGPADPVKALMHRHRELCERAVDPLEIAAGLEAHGVTDRTAARFRHRDVFSLAEELYARVPRGEAAVPRTDTGRTPGPGPASWALTVCAPGAVAGLATLGLALGTGGLRLAAGALGALGLFAALLLAARRGPLRVTAGPPTAAPLWILGLLAYAAAGDGLLDQLLRGGPDTGPVVTTVLDGTAGRPDDWTLDTAPLLALALSVAPAAWCARLFAVRARRRLAASRGLADFAAGARPLLLGTVALHLAGLAGLLVLTGFHPGALALGALLLTARLLAVHGFAESAARGLGAACAAEALALASVLAARLPGLDVLGAPVRALVAHGGPAALPALVCGCAALVLLTHATEALSRASAHA
ncbi:hypothetical protein ACF09L_29080 [Streptomyces sp. NPDC014779]|uniref:hypothetical protein n=1 Tax=Streptomyces sp. NPDC014779 TaxID=3364911 RepID=UPI0036F89D95